MSDAESSGSLTLVFGTAVALAVAALLSFAALLNFRAVEAEAFRQAEHRASALGEHALRAFRAHEVAIDFVDASVAGMSWDEIRRSRSLHEVLREVAGRSDEVAGIHLVGPEGELSLSSLAFPAPPLSLSDRDYFSALRSGNGPVIGQRGVGRLTQQPYFNVARRRSVGEERFDGLIAVSVDPAYFDRFYAALLEPGEVALLVRTDGVVLASHPLALPERLPPRAPLMQAIAEEQRGRYTARTHYDGVRRLVVYHQVPGLPAYASFQQPTSVIWARWRRVMAPYALASLLALIGLAAVIRNIDQRTRRELAEQHRRDAEEAGRAKDRFIATVSHEIRNPLSAILAAAELLRRSPEAAPTASAMISRQAKHLSIILQDLLDTARSMYGKLQLQRVRLDLCELANTVVEDRARQCSERATLAFAGRTAWTDADPARLTQVLDNLLENAFRYGGRQVRVEVVPGAEWHELRVHDNGEGIAPEVLPRIFDSFVQADAGAGGGLGLGLPLVRRLAELHGGSVRAESEGPGRGSCFIVRLPAAPGPEARS